ncbi:MAG: Txe/YoeB family addiction module toxin [Anaerovoracaceae bacterium]
MGYKVMILKKANKDKEKIKQYPALQKNVQKLIDIIKDNPYQSPPSFEALQGEAKGVYSRRINKQHRLVYKVNEKEKQVLIISMWSHYE